MEVEIIEVKAFPSTDPGRIGQPETVVFVRIDGREVTAVNLKRSVVDPETIKREVSSHLQARSKLIGVKFTA